MPHLTATFQRSATSKIVTPTSKPAPLLSKNGVARSLSDRKMDWGNGDWFSFVIQHK